MRFLIFYCDIDAEVKLTSSSGLWKFQKSYNFCTYSNYKINASFSYYNLWSLSIYSYSFTHIASSLASNSFLSSSLTYYSCSNSYFTYSSFSNYSLEYYSSASWSCFLYSSSFSYSKACLSLRILAFYCSMNSASWLKIFFITYF